MLYSIVKNVRNAPGSNVVIDIEWFDEDPSKNRDLMPILLDQVLVDGDVPADVTPEQVNAALNKRLPEVEIMMNRSLRPDAAVEALIGSARLVTGEDDPIEVAP